MSSAAMSGKAEKRDFSITCTLDDNWYDWAAHLATACGLVSSYSVAGMFIAVVAVTKLLEDLLCSMTCGSWICLLCQHNVVAQRPVLTHPLSSIFYNSVFPLVLGASTQNLSKGFLFGTGRVVISIHFSTSRHRNCLCRELHSITFGTVGSFPSGGVCWPERLNDNL